MKLSYRQRLAAIIGCPRRSTSTVAERHRRQMFAGRSPLLNAQLMPERRPNAWGGRQLAGPQRPRGGFSSAGGRLGGRAVRGGRLRGPGIPALTAWRKLAVSEIAAIGRSAPATPQLMVVGQGAIVMGTPANDGCIFLAHRWRVIISKLLEERSNGSRHELGY